MSAIPITTTLSPLLFSFLQTEAKQTHQTRKNIIENAIHEYRKKRMKQKVKEGLLERQDEYTAIQEEYSHAQFSSLSS